MRYITFLSICFLTFFQIQGFSQTQVVKSPRVSPRASISQEVGITEVTIVYSRPAVRGRTIWGS
ncbi:MAG: DUF2911 domain-containing protein, partial [Cryomorphaceae bacterium]